MTNSYRGWEQLSLIRPEAVEINLRIGLAARIDHAQFQIEIRNAGDGELLGMRSRPHVDWSAIWEELDVWLAHLRDAIEVHDSPF